MLKISHLFACLSTIILFGCSTQGYSGPARSSSEVATIYFKPDGRVSLKNKAVDGITQSVSTNGITVLPGQNKATADYQIALYECPMFSVGCFDEVLKGRCDFSLETKAGHSYAIDLVGHDKDVIVKIYDQSSDATAGIGSCTADGKGFDHGVMQRRSTIGEF